MKLPFKKNKAKEEFKVVTLQDFQNQFNQTMFELGTSVYKKYVTNQAIAELNDEQNTLTRKAMCISQDAQKLKEKIQSEVDAKVQEGKVVQKGDANAKKVS